MHTKVAVVVFFVFSLANCRCGLLDLFTEWTDALEQENAGIKCRETREANENGITNSASDKIVSLMDIEEGKLAAEAEEGAETTIQGYSKTKRCPIYGYVGSIRNPLDERSRTQFDPLSLTKRESEDHNQKMCTICRSQPTCKYFRKCDNCNKLCGNDTAITTNDNGDGNEVVRMASRMGQPKTDNIFSKTLYPISTYRDGETKEIICKIVGITDTSDIETVTIWVTTYSNNRPKSPGGIDEFKGKDPRRQEHLFDQKLKQVEPNKMSHNKPLSKRPQQILEKPMESEQSSQPDLKPRFNDYDSDNDNDDDLPPPQMRNIGEDLKENPDLIEGPPPFFRSNNNDDMVAIGDAPGSAFNKNGEMGKAITGSANKDVIVQPKEFESDESDENETLPKPETGSIRTDEEKSTINNIRPPLLNRLRELTTQRANMLSTLKNLPKPGEIKPNRLPAKGGFLQNLLKSKLGGPDQKEIASTPPNPIEDEIARNVATPSIDDIQNIPSEAQSTDKISQINEALQEVKTMVKNMQDEAHKASEKRLLGASHVSNIPETLVDEKAVDTPLTNSIQSAVPPRMVENLKKVNKYLINRAQDTLDTINHPSVNNEKTQGDDHSDITKNLITNFKKMPQFLLDKVKDTFNEFENNKDNIEPDGGGNIGNVQLSRRFGDNADDSDITRSPQNENTSDTQNGNNINDDNMETEVDENDDTLVELPPQTDLNEETPTTKAYKSKLEKYLAELKGKRQKMYSPEKYLNGPGKETTANNNDKLLTAQQLPKSATQKGSNELEKQGEALRAKLKKYIDDVRSKKISPTPGVGPVTEVNTPITDDMTTNVELSNRNTKLLQSDVNKAKIEKPQTIQEIKASGKPDEQLLGESNSINTPNSNEINYFLPTIPTINQENDGLNQITEKPSRFLKYLEDLRSKKPAKPLETNIPKLKDNAAKANQLLNANESKRNVLKDKIKQYVENLKNPAEERVTKVQPTLTPRGPDLNEILKPPSILESSTQNAKKELLKEKLKNYVGSLNKPMASRMNRPTDVKKFTTLGRKSSEAQKEELNALKRKLDNLLKERLAQKSPFNPIISESQPTINNNEVISPADVANDLQNGGGAEDINPVDKTGVVDEEEKPSVDQLGVASPLEDQPMDLEDVNLQNRVSFTEDNNLREWSSNLGKIVQSSSKPKDIFFMGNGIKLPLQIKQGKDGSLDFSVDIEKLCSCQNTTCPKNHTAAIEETVGAILEKEAELQDQLQNPSSDADPNSIKNIFGKIQHGKSNIFKRSSEMQALTANKLPSAYGKVATELTELGKQMQKSLTNSVQKLQGDAQELNEEVAKTLSASVNPNSLNVPFPKQTNLKKIMDKTDKMNKNILRKNEKDLSQLLKSNNIKKLMNMPNKVNIDEYIRNLEREKTLRKLLDQLSLPKTPAESVLRKIENQASSIINNFDQEQLMKKIIGTSKLQYNQNPLLLADQLKENLKNSLPTIPDLHDRVAEINDNNLAQISDAYQYTKINALQNQLKQLDNQVEEYEENNEKSFAEEAQKFFGGHNNKVVQEELSIFAKFMAWLNGLSSSEKRNKLIIN